MRVLVTGSTGFIGNLLCEALLACGHEVTGLSRNSTSGSKRTSRVIHFPYQLGDALPEGVISYRPEVIVHLAWDGIPDFSAKKSIANVTAQIKFLEEATRLLNIKKILVAGSCREYGNHNGICHENVNNPPDSYFSWAKQTLCDYFKFYCMEKKIALIWFRIFYVYGPGQRSESLIPTLLKAFRSGQIPEIINPNAANDFIYIDDVVNAFIRGIELEGAEGIMNLGTSNATTIIEVTQLVERIIHGEASSIKNLSIETVTKEKNQAMIADISKAKATLDWIPKVSLKRGVDLTSKAIKW